MASNNKVVVPGLFALALLLVAYGAEAYVCTTRNRYFHGPCKSHKLCAESCISGGVGTGGHCSGRVHHGAAADDIAEINDDGNADTDASLWRHHPWRRICKCTFECPHTPQPGPAPGHQQPPPPSCVKPPCGCGGHQQPPCTTPPAPPCGCGGGNQQPPCSCGNHPQPPCTKPPCAREYTEPNKLPSNDEPKAEVPN